MPKSRSLATGAPLARASRKMLSGLRSRWTMPAAWAASSAVGHRDQDHEADRGRAARRPARGQCPRLSPVRYSITSRGGRRASVPKSLMSTMFGRPDLVDGARFDAKPPDQLIALREAERQHLDRDGAIDLRVDRSIHRAHPAFAEDPDDAVVADGRTDQGRPRPRRKIPLCYRNLPQDASTSSIAPGRP